MSEKTNCWRRWEVAGDRDWISKPWLVGLFVMCAFLLAHEIRHLIQGHFHGPQHIQMNLWSIQNIVIDLMVAICCFLLALRFPKTSVKVASVLMGASYATYALLSCFYISSSAGYIVGVCGSVVRQIALIINCVAIAQWFKSTVHRDSQPYLGEGV